MAGEHKFMIAKSDATNDDNNYNIYWTNNTSDLSLTNYSKVDGTNHFGYLPRPDGTFGGSTHLSDDFTTWTNGALSDFNGKDNTEVIAAASSHAKDMCTVLNTFNQTEQTAGRSADWYVPACGQLALMYLNMTEINAAFAKIGGTALAGEFFWSSSEYSSNYAWGVYFNDGYVDNYRKDYFSRLLFVRDLPKSLSERVSDLESKIKDLNTSGSSNGAYAEINHGTSDTTFTLTPNTFHVWDEVASLDLSFADEQAGVANEYLFQFTSGATATTLTLPDTVKWANNADPNIAENMIYQVSILKGLASVLEFDNAPSVTLINFTIRNMSCVAIEGMTWEQWVSSEYNTTGCSIIGNHVYRMGEIVGTSSTSYVTKTDVITSDFAYITIVET